MTVRAFPVSRALSQCAHNRLILRLNRLGGRLATRENRDLARVLLVLSKPLNNLAL